MIQIDIVADYVCPWCYIGTRRLAVALEQVRQEFPELIVNTRWLPFFLNPDTPPAGEPYLPFLVQKFGSREKVEGIWANVAAAGRAYGLDYHFEKIQIRANTLNAHRLVHWAQERGDAKALIEAIYRAQFQNGENIGDSEVLLRLAVACGYDQSEVRDFLNSDAASDTVRAREFEVRKQGINMVPTFIVNGREIVVGAEDPAILAAAVRRCLATS